MSYINSFEFFNFPDNIIRRASEIYKEYLEKKIGIKKEFDIFVKCACVYIAASLEKSPITYKDVADMIYIDERDVQSRVFDIIKTLNIDLKTTPVDKIKRLIAASHETIQVKKEAEKILDELKEKKFNFNGNPRVIFAAIMYIAQLRWGIFQNKMGFIKSFEVPYSSFHKCLKDVEKSLT